jgi:hypothetical protein
MNAETKHHPVDLQLDVIQFAARVDRLLAEIKLAQAAECRMRNADSVGDPLPSLTVCNETLHRLERTHRAKIARWDCVASRNLESLDTSTPPESATSFRAARCSASTVASLAFLLKASAASAKRSPTGRTLGVANPAHQTEP